MTFFPSWMAQMEAGMTSIEAQWGEQADLLPWQSREAVRFVEPGPDTTRMPLLNVRVLFKRKMVTTSPVGDGSVGGQETYAVIRDTYIEQVDLQQGDRVRLINRNNELLEVSKLGQKYTTRQRVYLTSLQEPPT